MFTVLPTFQTTVESHNSEQVGCPEIVPYCGVFPYFASSLFTNGHFGHSGFVPYFASPYCERLLYMSQCTKQQITFIADRTVLYRLLIAYLFPCFFGVRNSRPEKCPPVRFLKNVRYQTCQKTCRIQHLSHLFLSSA